MSSLEKVPCVDVTSQNIDLLWPDITQSLRNCHLVALDLELTGLGPRQKLNAKLVDERYRAVIETAKSRSIVSLGLSFFTYCDDNDDHRACGDGDKGNESSSSTSLGTNRFEALENDSKMVVDEASSEGSTPLNEWRFSAKIYNLICLCEEEYVVEPDTMRFLVGHGFDFNSQFGLGLAYHRGNDHEFDDHNKPSIRNLVGLIVAKKLPIVLHNGFIDLIFLYQNFYCEIPSDMQVFLADLSEMFPAGIYDTKYIADFHARLGRSYLEYLFYERQRANLELKLRNSNPICIFFPIDDQLDVQYRDLSTKFFSNTQNIDICKDYAYHGWCKNNNSCDKSHNIDYILDIKYMQNRRAKKKMNLLKKISESNTSQVDDAKIEDMKSEDFSGTSAKEGVHRAGYDAFMTGYSFIMFVATYAKKTPNGKNPFNSRHLGISNLINNIYLTGKDQPLRVAASSFVKPSTVHKNKISKLRSIVS